MWFRLRSDSHKSFFFSVWFFGFVLCNFQFKFIDGKWNWFDSDIFVNIIHILLSIYLKAMWWGEKIGWKVFVSRSGKCVMVQKSNNCEVFVMFVRNGLGQWLGCGAVNNLFWTFCLVISSKGVQQMTLSPHLHLWRF